MLKASMDKNFLGRVDEVAGASFGLLKTAFILSVIVWIMNALRIHKIESWTENSRVYTKLGTFAPMVTKWIGKFIPFIKDVFST
jgi:membrane protein required for colicin V production